MRATEFLRFTPITEDLDTDPPLYHATLRAFEPSIMKQGLIPGCRLRMYDWCSDNYVFLAVDPDQAESFVDPGVIEPADQYQDEILELMKQGGVLFKIDQSRLQSDLFFTDLDDEGAETFAYRGRVPPDAIVGRKYFDIL